MSGQAQILTKVRNKIAISAQGKQFNAEKDRNPDYPIGDNRSCVGFRYHANEHPKGQILHRFIKPSIIKAINLAHGMILKQHGNDAYIPKDDRIIQLKSICNRYIDEDIQHDPKRKQTFMRNFIDIIGFFMEHDIYKYKMMKVVMRIVKVAHQTIGNKYDTDAYVYDDKRLQIFNNVLKSAIQDKSKIGVFISQTVDIICFIMKEDIYYTARWFNMLNHIIAAYPYGFQLTNNEYVDQWFIMINSLINEPPNSFELTKYEKGNIEIWH